MLLRSEEQMALNQVQSLVVESADHYETEAAKTHDEQLMQLFSQLVQERRQIAAELAARIRALDDLPQHPDPDKETLSELFTSIKAIFADDERNTLLEDRLRFEDRIAETARSVLEQPLPEDTKNAISAVLSSVERTKHRLQEMRP